MKRQDCEQLTLFQEDSHASHSVLPGSEEARKMTVTSGLKCCELYRRGGEAADGGGGAAAVPVLRWRSNG